MTQFVPLKVLQGSNKKNKLKECEMVGDKTRKNTVRTLVNNEKCLN